MKQPTPSLPSMRATNAIKLATQQPAQQSEVLRLERLARLFRNMAETPDDRYLHDLMTRYRGATSP